MAHEITIRENGFAEMAYVGERPWHGLGQQVSENASIEEMQKAAGMDWKICRSRVRFGDGENTKIMEDKHVLFRCDTKEALGIVGANYKIVQPAQVMEFFRDLTEGNGFKMHTAGTLFDGRRFWALASIGEEAVIMGEDRVGGYLLLSTSCDGTLATTARFTTVRVVCNNTLSMALSAKDKSVVSLSHKSAFDATAMKDQLGIATGHFAKFTSAARALAAKRINNNGAQQFINELLGVAGLEQDDISGQAKRRVDTMMRLFKGSALGGTLLSAEGTAWGLVNAVTEYVDHHSTERTAAAKLDSALFGKGDDLKTAAFAKALALV